MKDIFDVVIIGAGLGGVTLARQLKLQNILLIDKAKSIGGRAATRRVGEIPVNHGLEQFKGDHPFLLELTSLGLKENLLLLENEVFKPVGAINSWLKLLSKDINFNNQKMVYSIKREDGIFSILDNQNNLIAQSSSLVLSTPAPQAYEILKTSGHQAEFLKEVEYNSLIRHFVLLKERYEHTELILLKESKFGYLYGHEIAGPLPEKLITMPRDELNLHFLDAFSIPEKIIKDSHTHRWLYSQVVKPISKNYQTAFQEQKLFLIGDYFSLNGVNGLMDAVNRIALQYRT